MRTPRSDAGSPPRRRPPELSSAWLAAGCGAAIGLGEATRALLSLPHVSPAWAFATALAAVLGHATIAAVVVPFLGAVARRFRRDESPTQRAADRWALAAAAALGSWIAVLRLRSLAGFAVSGLIPFATGPLLEALVLSGAVFVLTRRVPPSTARRSWLSLAAVGVAGVIAASLAAAHRAPVAAPSASSPSLLLVSIDTLRADRLGAYGRRPSFTPNLDRLALRSVVFDGATSPVALTGPSHTSMLTGLYPLHHGAEVNGAHPRPDAVTVMELLARRGYATAGFVSGWTLTDRSAGLARRFQWYDDDLSPWRWLPDAALQVPIVWLADRAQMLVANWRRRSLPGRFVGRVPQRRGARTVENALSWIADQGDRPFFAFVHLFEPHGPYEPTPGSARRVDPDYTGDLSSFDRVDALQPVGDLLRSPTAIARIRALYEAEVADADEAVGRLLAGLDALGVGERCAIVFTADHGEGLGEHGEFFGHDDYGYETTVRVPLFVKLPAGTGAGQRVGEVVRLVDIAPTLLELAGSRAPGRIDGESLLPLVRGAAAPERTALGWDPRAWLHGRAMAYARRGALKLIWRLDNRWLTIGQPAREELYDLAADPGESRDLMLSGQPPEALATLRELLSASLAGRGKGFDTRDPEVEMQLRNLGYL